MKVFPSVFVMVPNALPSLKHAAISGNYKGVPKNAESIHRKNKIFFAISLANKTIGLDKKHIRIVGLPSVRAKENIDYSIYGLPLDGVKYFGFEKDEALLKDFRDKYRKDDRITMLGGDIVDGMAKLKNIDIYQLDFCGILDNEKVDTIAQAIQKSRSSGPCIVSVVYSPRTKGGGKGKDSGYRRLVKVLGTDISHLWEPTLYKGNTAMWAMMIALKPKVAQRKNKSVKKSSAVRSIIKNTEKPAPFRRLSDIEEVEENYISAKLKFVDELLAGKGLFVGRTYLLTGSSNAGKTTLGLQMCSSLSRGGHPVMLMSLEMPAADVRKLSTRLRINVGFAVADGEEISRLADGEIHPLQIVEQQFESCRSNKTPFMVIDSLQYYAEERGITLLVAMKEIVKFAERTNTTVLVIGQCNERGGRFVPAGGHKLVHTVFAHIHINDEGLEDKEKRHIEMLKNRGGVRAEVFTRLNTTGHCPYEVDEEEK